MAFSQTQADAACNFFEHILKHTADEWYGHPAGRWTSRTKRGNGVELNGGL